MLLNPREIRYLARGKWHSARARGIVGPAVGKKCVDCGGPANQYDHRDYTRPLDVVPVCGGCNTKRPEAFPPIDGPSIEVDWAMAQRNRHGSVSKSRIIHYWNVEGDLARSRCGLTSNDVWFQVKYGKRFCKKCGRSKYRKR